MYGLVYGEELTDPVGRGVSVRGGDDGEQVTWLGRLREVDAQSSLAEARRVVVNIEHRDLDLQHLKVPAATRRESNLSNACLSPTGI